MRRFALIIAVSLSVLGQQKPPVVINQPPKAETQAPGGEQTPPDITPLISTRVEVVQTPVLVFDHDGRYVNGIRPDQFRLFDDDKLQDINVDVAFTPISLVICIQANQHVEGLLPQVKKIGNLVAPLIIGDQGEAAVIAYDHRIRTLQDFTSDPDKITEAVKRIYPGSMSNRMVDAVSYGTRMLSTRPRARRRILMVIGETRDIGSESRSKEVLMALQLNNVMFYGVDMSRFITTLTAPPPVPRPNNLPPAMANLPPAAVATPTTVAQTYGENGGRAEFVPLMVEVFRDVKAIFKDNPVEVFTKGTGGSEFGFHSNRTLEEAMQHVGEEIHSEYTITYTPSADVRELGGFHRLAVDILGHPEVKRVQLRPGYWIAPRS
jgi:VWFA-related protein